MKYLVDTNACITLLRNRSPRLAARWRVEKPTDIMLCSIVVYELRFGAESSIRPVNELAKVDAFLAPYMSLPFDDECAKVGARLRKRLLEAGKVIGPHDLQIAAIALRHELTLVTHNTREFERVDDLHVEDWES